MASNPRQITSAELFFFFHACMPQKSFNKPFQFLLYKTNRLHFPMCVHCNRSQKKSQRVKNNSHATLLCLVSHFLFFTHCYVVYDLLQNTEYSTHTRENVIYLLIDIYVYISIIYAYIILVLHVRQPCNIFCLNVSLTFVFGC